MATQGGGDTGQVLVLMDSKQIHNVVSQLHDVCERDDSFRSKLHGAATQAWLTDGDASHLYDLESLVRVLAGVSVAGAMFEMNLRIRLVPYGESASDTASTDTASTGDSTDAASPDTALRYEAGVGMPVRARDFHPQTGLSGVVCVVSGEYFWVPEWFLLMSHEYRVQHLRQAASLALIDHGLPRTGVISDLPWLQR